MTTTIATLPYKLLESYRVETYFLDTLKTTPASQLLSVSFDKAYFDWPFIFASVLGFFGIAFANFTRRRQQPLPRKTTVPVNDNLDKTAKEAVSSIMELLTDPETKELIEVAQKEGTLNSILLSKNQHSYGLLEVFVPSRNGQCRALTNFGNRYCALDLLREIQLKEEQIKQVEFEKAYYVNDLIVSINEFERIQKQLQAETQLRLQAESKSCLLQAELERLHRVVEGGTAEMEDLNQQYKKVQIELELAGASGSELDETTRKAKEMFAEMKDDLTKINEEMIYLKERNKVLVQTNAHSRQKREEKMRELAALKRRVEELTPKVEKKKKKPKNNYGLGLDMNGTYFSQLSWKTSTQRFIENEPEADGNNIGNDVFDDFDH